MKRILLAMAVLGLTGCASQPNNIAAKHVSPLKYKDNSCAELCTEINLNTNRKTELYKRLKSEADADAVQTGVGLVLFWPALFLLEGGDGAEATEYSEIKGNEKAILDAMKLKGCKMIAYNEKVASVDMEINASEICQLPNMSEEIKKGNKSE